MDRRQQKTKKAIFNAFTTLLARKEFNKITIQEIITLADISRSTFYAHFSYKEEIMESLCDELFDHIFDKNLSKEKTHDFSKKRPDARSTITHLLYHFQEQSSILAKLMEGDSKNLFLLYFKNCLEDLALTYIVPLIGVRDKKLDSSFITHHICISLIGMTEWWIKEGMKKSPEEMTEAYLTLINYL